MKKLILLGFVLVLLFCSLLPKSVVIITEENNSLGTNIKNDRNHYMQRKRIVGDLHGQAPLLWCAVALLR